MFKKTLIINEQKLKIKLEVESSTGKPIIDMDYLGLDMRQTITSEELSIDLTNLAPTKIESNPFCDEDEKIVIVMWEQLKIVIQKHINQYGRLLQADLGTYIAETIVIIDAYCTQFLKMSFESKKKKTFNMFFNFFYNQLPPEWNQ